MTKRVVAAVSAVLVAGLPVLARAQATNVHLILDASGSMAGRIEGRGKIDIAKEVLLGLLGDLPPDARVAVTAYGHRRKGDCADIETLAPLGPRAPERFAEKIRALRPTGMTPIAAALEAVGRDLAGRPSERNVVVLVSDGVETCKGDPCAVARQLRATGAEVRVNVIGFDVKAEERRHLECIADAGGGKYYSAASASEFRLAATEVTRQVAQAQPAPGAGTFRDEFEGTKLGPSWKILKEDKNRWAVEGGKLLIITQKGGIWKKADNLKNQFVLERDLPADYVVTTKLATTLRSQNNWAALLIHLDKDHYLQLGYWGKPWGNNVYRRPFFAKEVAGEPNVLEFGPREVGGEAGAPKIDFMGPRTSPETIWLRLEKRGSTFTGAFSMDGARWHKIGDHSMLRMGGARLGLMASNDQTDGAEVAAEFDFVEVAPAP